VNSPAVASSSAWSARRWLLTIGAVFALQILLVLTLSNRILPRVTPALRGAQYQLVTEGSATSGLAELPWLGDAAEFALAGGHGFTGDLWRRLPRLKPQLPEWTEPPRWLAADPRRLGTLLGTGHIPGLAGFAVADRPTPTLPGRLLPATPVPPGTTLTVAGGLQGRALAAVPPLPTWPFNDILEPTTVQVAVDDHGAVVSANLLTHSELEAADQQALVLARQTRFAVVPSATRVGPLAWGELVFHWQTLPPSTEPKP